MSLNEAGPAVSMTEPGSSTEGDAVLTAQKIQFPSLGTAEVNNLKMPQMERDL